MSTAVTVEPVAPVRPAVADPGEQHFVLNSVSYQAYVTIADALGEQPIRLTYDRGRLEFMTISLGHEGDKEFFILLRGVLMMELGIRMVGGGSVTCRAEELDRGMEPDSCCWIQNEPAMRGRRQYNPATDPPPDLAVEVEISRSLIDRLGIYAALGIPEVWRWDGTALHVLTLDQGTYQEQTHSRAFPFLAAADLNHFLAQRLTAGDTAALVAFRDWLRARPAAHGAPESP